MKEREAEGALQFTNLPIRKNSKFSLPQTNTRVLTPAIMDPFTQKIDIFVKAFEKVCCKLQTTIEIQNQKILLMEDSLIATLAPRLDKLLSINQKICDTLQRNGSPTKEKQPLLMEDRKVYKQREIERVSSLKDSIMSLSKGQAAQTENKTLGLTLPPLSILDKPIGYEISPIRKKTVSVEEMRDKNNTSPILQVLSPFSNKILDTAVIAYCNPLVSEASQSEINRWVGRFYNQTTAHYFDLYSKGSISYEDMKIKFSFDIIQETLNLSTKWSQFCKNRQGATFKEKNTVRRPQFYYMLNEASKRKLQFLINKYPPSRKKRNDTDISEKIKDTSKEFSIVKYDMLSNARMDIGLDQKQTDFTKEIKVWLNRLVTQTKNQFPNFKEKMRSIFVNQDQSIQMGRDMISELEFVIGSKISQGTTLFNQEELDAPGLQLHSTQLLRILMKWCEQLSSYFMKHDEKIYGNSAGFKTIRGSLPIKIPKSRLDLLVGNLKDIYENEIVPCLEIEHNNIGQLVTDLISLASDGIMNYEFLNSREISILKLSDYLNESLKAHVLNFLNLMLGKLVKVRSRYEDQKLESNLNLVTFGVMDILRCRCVGSKSEIYRIYKEILSNQDYFEIIRVKNKLNTPTRDIIINCKIKESFLICQVQLSLGEAEEEVNDHFCHFLYELERTNFGVVFECASQICNLDPRMNYLYSHKDIKFKASTQRKAVILQNIHQNPNEFTCQFNHDETVMYSENTCQPFCCSLCTSFKPGLNLCLPYLRCMTCNTSLCPECIMMLGKSHAGFIAKYTSDDSKFQKLFKFFYPQHIYQNVESSMESLKQISIHLLRFPYVLHMVVDNIGHKPTIYKRYKNTYIQTFSTLQGVVSQPKTTSRSNWNYMVGMKPYERKLINQLKDYRKYSVSMDWSDLEEILKEKGIQDVIVVIDEGSKTALIVDIIEEEEDIETCLVKKQVQKTISEVNKSGQRFLELTSKGLVDVSLLDGIQSKKQIKVLNLWENKIKNIDLLSEFREVKELFLRQNQVESIDPILGMKELEIAVVSSNKIKGSLPVLVFPHLSVLDISLNEFTDITNISKSDLKRLTFFKLVNTKVRQIPMMNLPKLETFWFDYNGIYNIVNLSASSLPKLAKVSGTHNNITGELPQLPFPKLQSLILNYNQIFSINKFSQTLSPNLKILAIHHNSISGALPNLNIPTLVKLDLSYNKISSLNFISFTNNRFSMLESLDLKSNQIFGEFPVMELRSLRKLDLSNNSISGIQNMSTSKLPLLQYLDLSKNQIKGPLYPLRFQRLRKLILSFNEISEIKSLSDSKIPKLQILKLNNNVIRSVIPKMYFQNLRRIDLSSNFVSNQQFLSHLHLLPSLQKVFLINNPPALKASIPTPDMLQTLLIFNQEYNE